MWRKFKEVLNTTNSEQANFDFVQEEINHVFAHVKNGHTPVAEFLLEFLTESK